MKWILSLLVLFFALPAAAQWNVSTPTEKGVANYDQTFTFSFASGTSGPQTGQDMRGCTRPEVTLNGSDTQITAYDCQTATYTSSGCTQRTSMPSGGGNFGPTVVNLSKGFLVPWILNGGAVGGSVVLACRDIPNKTYVSGTGWVDTYTSGSGGGNPGGTVGQVQANNGVGGFSGIAEGTSGQVLVSQGTGVAPAFSAITTDTDNVAISTAWTPTNVDPTQPPCNVAAGSVQTNLNCAFDEAIGNATGAPGGTTGQVQVNNAGAFGGVAEGAAGQVLTSNGAGVAPTFQAAAGGGQTQFLINPALLYFSGTVTAVANEFMRLWTAGNHTTNLDGIVVTNGQTTGHPIPASCTITRVETQCTCNAATATANLVLRPTWYPSAGVGSGAREEGDQSFTLCQGTTNSTVSVGDTTEWNTGNDTVSGSGGYIGLLFVSGTISSGTMEGQCSMLVTCQ